MTLDQLCELETTRRRALWALASHRPGDPNAYELLTILDNLYERERDSRPSLDKPLDLNEVRDRVPVQHHHSGIDIISEQNIPQPWRERFHQASIGSTRLVDGPYAKDWKQFLAEWEAEMRHLQQHRAARRKPGTD
ncbi:hypothetical protein [Pseudomonas sp. 2822-15]|uniref:hypothetical protein n=1 Tax=Pseudomonas sp. 2822-15 TaxID=1712677 RepID=UPI000C1448CE|nr:hypothetical protein [Pseudomonas sp. 2822-15]